MELTPTFDIRFNSGENVIRDRVIDISTNDAAGFESDSCAITLDERWRIDNATNRSVDVCFSWLHRNRTR